VSGTRHPEIMRAEEDFLPYKEMEKILEQLNQACIDYRVDKIKTIIINNHVGYAPSSDEVNDLLWCQMGVKSNGELSIVNGE
jgi:FlaA1/EpsC-like NDP-sugar epimerase